MLDAHCHIDRYKSPNKIALDADKRGVFTIAMTNLPSHFLAGLPHVQNIKRIRLALGMHPLVASHHMQERKLFEQSLSLTSFVGEVGLDFSREGKDTQDLQIDTFRFIAKLVSGTHKVISLHSRGAEAEILEILAEFKITASIFHWYTGSVSSLDEAISHGHYFSVNPAMIRSEKGQQIIKRIPVDRLLTESDGPYVKNGKFSIKPWDVIEVEKYLSRIWDVPLGEVSERIWANFRRLLIQKGLVSE